MNLLRRLFKWVTRGRDDGINDPWERHELAVAEEAFRTGKIVYGQLDESGTLHFIYEERGKQDDQGP